MNRFEHPERVDRIPFNGSLTLEDGRLITIYKTATQVEMDVDGLCKSIGDQEHYTQLGEGDLDRGIMIGAQQLRDEYNIPPREQDDGPVPELEF